MVPIGWLIRWWVLWLLMCVRGWTETCTVWCRMKLWVQSDLPTLADSSMALTCLALSR